MYSKCTFKDTSLKCLKYVDEAYSSSLLNYTDKMRSKQGSGEEVVLAVWHCINVQ